MTRVTKPIQPAPVARPEPKTGKSAPEPAESTANDAEAKCTICGLRSCWRG